jgi:hypothetical protein
MARTRKRTPGRDSKDRFKHRKQVWAGGQDASRVMFVNTLGHGRVHLFAKSRRWLIKRKTKFSSSGCLRGHRGESRGLRLNAFKDRHTYLCRKARW